MKRVITVVLEIENEEKSHEVWTAHKDQTDFHGATVRSIDEGNLHQRCYDRNLILVDQGYGAIYWLENNVLKQTPIWPDHTVCLDDGEDVDWSSLLGTELDKIGKFLTEIMGSEQALSYINTALGK